MKKLLLSVLFSGFVLTSSDVHANERTSSKLDTLRCDEIVLYEYDAAIDSIDALFTKIKKSLTKVTWDEFVNDFRNDNPETAFSRCGLFQDEYRSKFIEVHNNFVYKINALREAIYSSSPELSDSEKFRLVQEKIECHSNNISLYRVAGPEIGEGPGGTGPCDSEYSRCKKAARRTRNAGWWACTLGGLGVSVVSGGLGLGLGVSCHVQNTIDYNNAIDDCTDAYNECLFN